MGQRTPLYDAHVKAGAKIIDFGGWDMPLHYGSQVDEHHKVRQDAGMFDVSHMCVVDLTGRDARAFLRVLIANNVDKLRLSGKALYTCMLNPQGCVIDDLIVYFMTEWWFRLVVNAGTREKDLAWIREQAQSFKVEVRERRDLAMIAVQGPNAAEKVWSVMGDKVREATEMLSAFNAVTIGELFVARTGYTGEDGFEIVAPAKSIPFLWQQLLDAGVAPIGLGARDTLRLEAGMNLYGSDMDETVTPLEAGLKWTVSLDDEERRFIGREALEQQRAQGVQRKLVGLVLEGRGVLRNHQKVRTAAGEGEITSGSFSPTLNKSIAFARIPTGIEVGSPCEVEIRGQWLPARVVHYPFVRNGKSCL